MLKFRNISLLRRIYVWGLAFITRVAYGPDIRAAASPEAGGGTPDALRINRINQELEYGTNAWKNDFLEKSGRASSDSRDEPFQLEDIAPFLSDGIEAIVGDTLTACFTADPPDPWNFLTRNVPPGKWQMSPYNTLLWLIGIWARYCVFLPFRFLVIVVGVFTFTMGYCAIVRLPKSKFKKYILQWLLRYLASVFVASWSGYIKFHGKRPEPQPPLISVATPTTLLAVFILNKDYTFSCIGQRHSGLAGFLQELLLSAQDHVWFDREMAGDRRAVQRLLRAHVADGTKEPMLVFPEGTCTHSEYCVMFKKGSFELGAAVHPIAMRYRRRFGDPFWNSQTTSFPRHLFDLMTSWAVVCDVYYMEPQTIQEGETPVEFANRVKRLVCDQAGLTSVNWDGFLKRHRISPKFMDSRRQTLAKIITKRLNGELPRPFSSSVLAGLAARHAQTDDAVPGVTEGSGLDTLGVYKSSNSEDNRDDRSATQGSSSLYRDILSLRRRRAGMPSSSSDNVDSRMETREAAERPGLSRRVRESNAVRFVEGAAHAAFRWLLAIGMLAVAGMVTIRFMPFSWKQAVRDGFS